MYFLAFRNNTIFQITMYYEYIYVYIVIINNIRI